jgi:hypothetical protein
VLLIIVGSGRIFQQKITVETYFNESVQGLDVGSKVNTARGHRRGDQDQLTYTVQQDKPMTERLRAGRRGACK